MVTSVTVHKIHIKYISPVRVGLSEKMESELDARLLEDFDSHRKDLFGVAGGATFRELEAETEVWKVANLADRDLQAIIIKWGGRIL